MPNKRERESGIVEFGCFVWRGDSGYTKSDALKVYKSRALAERYAESRNLVVRGLNARGSLQLMHDTGSAYDKARARERRRY